MGSPDATGNIDVNFDVLEHLPISHYILEDLEKVVVAVVNHVGDRLKCLALYGSIARGEWHAPSSNVNLCIVLDEIDYKALEPLQKDLSAARRSARIIPFILSQRDLDDATDVFPIKFEDIRRHHILLAGTDVFADLVVEPRDLAFVAEFKLRNTEWRLRQSFLNSFGTPRNEAALLLTHFSSAMFPLRAACRVLGYAVPSDTGEAISTIERALNADAGILRALLDLHKTRAELSQSQLSQLYLDFSSFIHTAVDKVNVLNQ